MIYPPMIYFPLKVVQKPVETLPFSQVYKRRKGTQTSPPSFYLPRGLVILGRDGSLFMFAKLLSSLVL